MCYTPEQLLSLATKFEALAVKKKKELSEKDRLLEQILTAKRSGDPEYAKELEERLEELIK
jgi:DNA-binding protein H-NS